MYNKQTKEKKKNLQGIKMHLICCKSIKTQKDQKKKKKKKIFILFSLEN